MSIQTDLTRIRSAKAAIKAAIEGKGVTVPDATMLDGMAALIDSIQAGGSANLSNIAFGSVTNASSSDMGSLPVMSSDEWNSRYGDLPTTFFGAIFDENADNIKSGTRPLFMVYAKINGVVMATYFTVYRLNVLTYYKVTKDMLSVNTGNIFICGGGSSATNFKSGRTYRWVVLW